MSNLLIVAGIVLLLAGAAFKLLERSGFRGLPGDIFFQKGGFSFVFPVVTCIVISIVLSVIFSFLGRR